MDILALAVSSVVGLSSPFSTLRVSRYQGPLSSHYFLSIICHSASLLAPELLSLFGPSLFLNAVMRLSAFQLSQRLKNCLVLPFSFDSWVLDVGFYC